MAQQVEWAMEKTEVTALQDKPIHFLSLGQKKRVAIAGVLAMDPEVFILDEPSAGLDAYYSKQIMQILRDIHQAMIKRLFFRLMMFILLMNGPMKSS